MNDWFESLGQTVDRLTEDMDRFAAAVGDRLLEAVDATLEASDAAMEKLSNQVNETLAPEWVEAFEQQIKVVDAAVDQAMAQTEVVMETTLRPVGQTLNPMLNQHSTCIGCRNYEGSEFGGNMLVCAIHPFGCEADQCPDWESTWQA